MKNLKRFCTWIVLTVLSLVYAFVFVLVASILLRSIEQGVFKTILFDILVVAVLATTFWVNMIFSENYPRISLFWSFMFNSRRVINIEDAKNAEEFVVFGIEDKFLYVDSGGETEKLLGARKYFPNIEFGDVLGRLGSSLYHSRAKETVSVVI